MKMVLQIQIDPDCNFFKTLNTTFTSKYYLKSNINEIINNIMMTMLKDFP